MVVMGSASGPFAPVFAYLVADSMPGSMPSSTVPDTKLMKVGPYDLPHADKACLLGCQCDAILAQTGVLCHVRDAERCGIKKGPLKRMMLIMRGTRYGLRASSLAGN